ncbi:hypothetical protein JCM14124_17460 [Humidesulfovibrio idahonensis]
MSPLTGLLPGSLVHLLKVLKRWGTRLGDHGEFVSQCRENPFNLLQASSNGTPSFQSTHKRPRTPCLIGELRLVQALGTTETSYGFSYLTHEQNTIQSKPNIDI